jgi:DNA-binding CsgD family transcriptional regulator
VSGQVRVLTRRQVEVLRLAANGNTSAEIAARLGVTANSINGILQAAYRALGVGDRAHAVAVALRVGLLRPGEIHVPERLRARLAPVGGSEAPGLRPSAAGASGGDGAGFNRPGKPSSRTGDSRSDPSEAEAGPGGGSPGLTPRAGPSRPPSL